MVHLKRDIIEELGVGIFIHGSAPLSCETVTWIPATLSSRSLRLTGSPANAQGGGGKGSWEDIWTWILLSPK